MSPTQPVLHQIGASFHAGRRAFTNRALLFAECDVAVELNEVVDRLQLSDLKALSARFNSILQSHGDPRSGTSSLVVCALPCPALPSLLHALSQAYHYASKPAAWPHVVRSAGKASC
jgi:hypothetical protein